MNKSVSLFAILAFAQSVFALSVFAQDSTPWQAQISTDPITDATEANAATAERVPIMPIVFGYACSVEPGAAGSASPMLLFIDHSFRIGDGSLLLRVDEQPPVSVPTINVDNGVAFIRQADPELFDNTVIAIEGAQTRVVARSDAKTFVFTAQGSTSSVSKVREVCQPELSG